MTTFSQIVTIQPNEVQSVNMSLREVGLEFHWCGLHNLHSKTLMYCCDGGTPSAKRGHTLQPWGTVYVKPIVPTLISVNFYSRTLSRVWVEGFTTDANDAIFGLESPLAVHSSHAAETEAFTGIATGVEVRMASPLPWFTMSVAFNRPLGTTESCLISLEGSEDGTTWGTLTSWEKRVGVAAPGTFVSNTSRTVVQYVRPRVAAWGLTTPAQAIVVWSASI